MSTILHPLPLTYPIFTCLDPYYEHGSGSNLDPDPQHCLPRPTTLRTGCWSWPWSLLRVSSCFSSWLICCWKAFSLATAAFFFWLLWSWARPQFLGSASQILLQDIKTRAVELDPHGKLETYSNNNRKNARKLVIIAILFQMFS